MIWKRRKPTPEELRAETIAAIREHMAALGHPLDNLSDEQIEKGAVRMSRLLASVGISMAQATEGLRRAMAAMP